MTGGGSSKPRRVKVSFRRKHGSRPGTVEVYTSVRLEGVKHPLRKHICYVPVGSALELSEAHRKKITEKTVELFRNLELAAAVEIDWANADAKLERIDEPRVGVDRKVALKQIEQWMNPNVPEDVVSRAFTDAPTKKSEMTAEEFAAEYWQRAGVIGGRDDIGFADWWEDREAPRLLHAFYRFVKRKHGECPANGELPSFNRRDFATYLAKHSNRNARVDYARWLQANGSRAMPSEDGSD